MYQAFMYILGVVFGWVPQLVRLRQRAVLSQEVSQEDRGGSQSSRAVFQGFWAWKYIEARGTQKQSKGVYLDLLGHQCSSPQKCGGG